MPAEEDVTERVVVITGAAAVPRAAVDAIGTASFILAVDGGLDHARNAGLTPHRLIGDLDSISEDGLRWATEHIDVVRHPAAKDETDTQLALRHAVEAGTAHVTMIGGGDRLDHTLAALGALAAPQLAELDHLDAWWDGQHLVVLHGPRCAALELPRGSTVSVIALAAPALVSIGGVRWPLDHHELAPLDGLGVSNEVVDGASIEAHRGVVAVFDHPIHDTPTPQQEEPPA